MDIKEKAKMFAIKAHMGQVRKSEPDKPMIIHPLSVGMLLEEYGYDDNVIAAGYLHDVVEDTKYTIEDIEKYFSRVKRDTAEVLQLGIDICQALEVCEDKNIIHRDIKPQNVIILEDGRVKIMDFGIAVALNAGEFTQTNSVMGTVYYIPPEQANGGAATIKSDIYSLGILMYELVTGHVPFKGDNPVEVAIKHMNEPIPSICEYDPEMPQSIENIILRASAKNPRNRYESAWEMHEDLETALDKERFNEPKVVYKYPEKGFDDDDDKPLPRGGRVARNAENEETKKDKRMNKALIILGTIVGVLIAALLFVFILWPRISSGSDVEIPDVQGMTVEQAQNALEDDGLEVEKKTKEEASDDVDEGKVIGTDPEIGESVKEGTKVTLIVSTGSEKIEIEDYTGEDVDDVKRELEDAGIRVVTEERDVASGDGVKENTIIDQDVEPGTKLGDGDTITLTIPNIYKTYPNFTDGTYTEDDVKKFCDENGITLNVTYIEDMTKSEGVVTYQNMGAGSRINSGDNLRIKVVKNPELENATEPSDTGDM